MPIYTCRFCRIRVPLLGAVPLICNLCASKRRTFISVNGNHVQKSSKLPHGCLRSDCHPTRLITANMCQTQHRAIGQYTPLPSRRPRSDMKQKTLIIILDLMLIFFLPPKALCSRFDTVCAWVIKFVNMIYHKPLAAISPNLKLGCNWLQRGND